MTSFDDLVDPFTTLDRSVWQAEPRVFGDGTYLTIHNTNISTSGSHDLSIVAFTAKVTDGTDPRCQCRALVYTNDVEYTSTDPPYTTFSIYKAVVGSPLGDGVPALVVQYTQNGAAGLSYHLPWDPVNHAWFRIEQQALDNTVRILTSPDTLTWHIQLSTPVIRPLTQCGVFLQADTTGTNGVRFSNIAVGSYNVVVTSDEAHPVDDAIWTISERTYLDTGGGVVSDGGWLETVAHDYDIANASVTIHFAEIDQNVNAFLACWENDAILEYMSAWDPEGANGYVLWRSASGTTDYAYVPAPRPLYIRFSTDAAGIATIAASADGTTWYRLVQSTEPVVIAPDGYMSINCAGGTSKFAAIEHIPPGAYADGSWPPHDPPGFEYIPYDDFGEEGWDSEPDYSPAYMPAKPEPECATLLQLVQDFSAAVRRAVRITGPTSIEIVSPDVPLPDGWTEADARNIYYTTTHSLDAGETTLSLLAGNLALNATATLVTDDVRLPLSSWQIPDHLPVYGLHPAKVSRMSYTFTPDHFQASLGFHFNNVPLSVRRT